MLLQNKALVSKVVLVAIPGLDMELFKVKEVGQAACISQLRLLVHAPAVTLARCLPFICAALLPLSCIVYAALLRVANRSITQHCRQLQVVQCSLLLAPVMHVAGVPASPAWPDGATCNCPIQKCKRSLRYI